MKWATLALVLMTSSASADPFEIAVQTTGFRVEGTITLREPVSDKVLGRYEFVTGGAGRGPAPWGTYEIGRFRDDGWIGNRWDINQAGIDPIDGDSAYDPRLKSMRTWLQIHSMHAGHWKVTLGCFGIFGGPKVYADFQAKLRFLIAWLGTVKFSFFPSADPWSAIARAP